MSHFTRWWHKQENQDEAAKNFARHVWTACSLSYQKTINKLNAELKRHKDIIEQLESVE